MDWFPRVVHQFHLHIGWNRLKKALTHFGELTINAILNPNASPISGALKQHAKAISGFPALVITISATQSAAELPTARIVKPIIATFEKTY